MKTVKHRLFILPTIILMILLKPKLVIAATTLDSVLQNFTSYLTATPARLIAILAIVGVGFSTVYLGKLPKERAIATVVGIGIIFGGATLLNVLGVS